MIYDIVIAGGGPAAISAGVYAARKKLKTLLVTENFGGQSIVSDSIGNWIGEIEISGFDLSKKLEKHLRSQKEISIKTSEKVLEVLKTKCGFDIKTDKETYSTKTVLVATGGRRRKLGVPGEEIFDGKGVAYCSTCDAPLFRGKTVAVVGGGNAGLEAVVDLTPYASKIFLLNRGKVLSGDPATQEQIINNNKVEIIYNSETIEIAGEVLVKKLKYKDLENNEEKELKLDGVFVEIGSIPNSEPVKGLLELNKYNEIVVNHKTYETSQKGIFAAGDVTDEIFKQNNIAAGDAITAVLSAYTYLLNFKKETPAAGCE